MPSQTVENGRWRRPTSGGRGAHRGGHGAQHAEDVLTPPCEDVLDAGPRLAEVAGQDPGDDPDHAADHLRETAEGGDDAGQLRAS
jgi:hypothetical protein